MTSSPRYITLMVPHNGTPYRQVQAVSGQVDQQQRIKTVFGQSFVDQALYFEEKLGEVTFKGWISLPTFSRSQADQQYFFVNGRSIRDKVCSHAVREGYQDGSDHGRTTGYAICLDFDHEHVDVNVHHTSNEVRRRDSRASRAVR